MKLLRPLLALTLTIFLALVAFTYVATGFPVTMRDLLASVNEGRAFAESLGLAERNLDWAEILLWPNLAVFCGFAIAVQFLIDTGRILLNRWRARRKPAAGQ